MNQIHVFVVSEPHWTSNWASIDYKIQPFNMVLDLWSQSESTRSKRNRQSQHVNKQRAHSWTGLEPLVGWTTSTTQTYWGQYVWDWGKWVTTELIICLKHLTQTPRTPCAPVWDKRGLTKRRYLTSRGRRYLTSRDEKCWSHCWGNCSLREVPLPFTTAVCEHCYMEVWTTYGFFQSASSVSCNLRAHANVPIMVFFCWDLPEENIML